MANHHLLDYDAVQMSEITYRFRRQIIQAAVLSRFGNDQEGGAKGAGRVEPGVPNGLG